MWCPDEGCLGGAQESHRCLGFKAVDSQAGTWAKQVYRNNVSENDKDDNPEDNDVRGP